MHTTGRSSWRAGLFVARLAGLWVGLSGCPKKPPPEEEEPLPPAIETELQIVSVSPGVISPEEPTALAIYGAGFQRGIKGWLGETPALRINWKSANQLEMLMPAMKSGSYDVIVQNPGGADD